VQLFRKIAFYAFIVASLCFAVWGYLKLRENKEPQASIAEHIPAGSVCVIETNNVHELITQLTRQNLIWKSLLTHQTLMSTQKVISYLDSLVNTNADIKEVVAGNKIYWSFLKNGNTFNSIIQFKLKEKSNETVVAEFFEKVFTKDASVALYDAYTVFINKQKWQVGYKNGIVYVSSQANLVEQCVSLKKEESIAADKAYQELVKINGTQTIQVYFNHRYADLFDRSLFTQQSFFNAEVRLNAITLNGYTLSDSLSFFNLLRNQEEGSIRQFENLPNNPVSVKAVTLSDAKLFYRRLESVQQETLKEKSELAWKALNDSALYNLKEEWLENIDAEIASGSYIVENNRFSITTVKLKDAGKTQQQLRYMSDSVAGSEMPVYRISEQYQTVFSVFDPLEANRFACLQNGSLFFFSDEKALAWFTQCVSTSAFLGKNAAFMDYANDNLFQECNYLYYENAEHTKQYKLKSLLNSEELIQTDKAVSHISLSVKNYKEHLQVRLSIAHARENSHQLNTSSNTLWEFAADSSIISPVSLFTNHLTQENELCFQDNENNLYLVGCTGGLMWKKELSEPILSQIYTVDIFKNGKLQLLFNTENYLHLLDRNGNYVQGYPVKLPAKITSSITLLDYEHTKDYRLYFACADKKIYNYTLYGVKTEGFVPLKTNAVVKMPVQYVKVGLSDYLITADVSGNIYVFSRKGEGRIDFKNKTTEDLGNFYVVGGNNLDNTKLIYVDDKNNLLDKISLADKKEAIKIGDELKGFKTEFALIDDDTQPDMLMFGDGAVYAYDLFSGKLLESFNEQAVYENAQVVNTTDNEYILAFDRAGQKINVISMDGKVKSTIQNATQKPLVSNLYKNGKTYVLIVSGNKVSCQELN
jgi:hypothetical protein